MTRCWGGGRSALLLAALLPAACMRTVYFDHPDSTGGANDGTGGTSGGGGNSGIDSGSADVPTDTRGMPHCSGGTALTSLNTKQAMPSIVFALDRSSSMKTGLGGTNGSNQTRFSVTAQAITTTVSNYSTFAQFGYVEFPGTQSDGSCPGPAPGCCAGGLAATLPAGSNGNAANSIANKMGMCEMNPFNNCAQVDVAPTGQALKKSAVVLQGATAWQYVVLLTDGAPSPSCTIDSSGLPICDQTVKQIGNMSGSQSSTPIFTFVVAVGEIPPDADECLSMMASAGGRPASATAPFYFSAPTDTAVRSQIDTIVASTICQWDITDNLDSGRPIEVDFNNSTLTQDPTRTNGWDIDRSSGHITVYGPACTMLLQQLKNTSHHLTVKGCLDTSHSFQPPNP